MEPEAVHAVTLFEPDLVDLRFAVIDVETTGIDIEVNRVLELAVIELDGDGVEVDAWSTLFSVPGESELGATHIHGITRTMTDGAPTFDEARGEIVARLRGRVIVGHVVSFDLGHLAAEFTRAGSSLPALRPIGICTREIVKAQLPPDSRTLRACCDRLGVSYVDEHSALGDARATAMLFTTLRGHFGDCGVERAHYRAQSTVWPEISSVAGPAWSRAHALAYAPAIG